MVLGELIFLQLFVVAVQYFLWWKWWIHQGVAPMGMFATTMPIWPAKCGQQQLAASTLEIISIDPWIQLIQHFFACRRNQTKEVGRNGGRHRSVEPIDPEPTLRWKPWTTRFWKTSFHFIWEWWHINGNIMGYHGYDGQIMLEEWAMYINPDVIQVWRIIEEIMGLNIQHWRCTKPDFTKWNWMRITMFVGSA